LAGAIVADSVEVRDYICSSWSKLSV